ncbi:MAG: shikimate kinase [Alphaproteobacteria bacterium]|nr:shikimate kinase [Alphaproteobacteria bacterium]
MPNTQPVTADSDIVSALGTRSIVLIGMMGVGKSTIGRRLATRLRLPFVDADSEIEAAADMTIAEIFERDGEPYFREREARVISRLLGREAIVLATGGGAFLRQDTREHVAASALSIWLKAEVDVIMRRVRRRADRPLLRNPDPEGTVIRLLAEREPFYALADMTVVSCDVPHDEIVEMCVSALRQHLSDTFEAGRKAAPADPT